MDILFVTSDPALASAVKGTLESARHTVSAASDVDLLAGAWPHGTPVDLVIIDDLSAHDLLDETRRSLSRLMDGKAGDGTGTAVRPRTSALHSPAHAEGEPGRHAAGQTADPVADDPQNRPGQGRRAGRPAGRAPIVSGRRFQRPADSRG